MSTTSFPIIHDSYWTGLNMSGGSLYSKVRVRQWQRHGECQTDPIEVHGSIVMLAMTLGNGSGTNFGASQCIPMDLDPATAAAADARCVYTFKVWTCPWGGDRGQMEGESPCMVRSNVSWIIINGQTGPHTGQTDRHNWKDYLPATSSTGGKNEESQGFDWMTTNMTSKHPNHSTIKSKIKDKIFKLILIYTSVIFKNGWVYWIQ